jgi:hypothetical protein
VHVLSPGRAEFPREIRDLRALNASLWGRAKDDRSAAIGEFSPT